MMDIINSRSVKELVRILGYILNGLKNVYFVNSLGVKRIKKCYWIVVILYVFNVCLK